MAVFSPEDGVVQFVGAAQGYGGPDPCGWVVIRSADRVWELGHIRRLPNIVVGSKVSAGQQVAVVNPNSATNGGTAPHLHVSVMPGTYNPERKTDPLPLLLGAKEPEGDVNRPPYNEYPMWSRNSQDRGGSRIDLFLLHTQEGDGNADSLARFLGNPANEVSYHYTVSQANGGVTVVDVVDTDRASWSVLSANNRSINLCFAGSRASWSTAEWMRNSKAIDVAAYLAVQDCRKYGIPLKVIAPPYTAGRAGISDHNYVTQVLRDGSHTDVGKNFPWRYFESKVAEYSGTGKPTSESGDDMFTDADRELLKQIAGYRRPSRSPLRHLGEGEVDTIAGFAWSTDGLTHPQFVAMAARYGHMDSIALLAEVASADPVRFPDRQEDAKLARAILNEVANVNPEALKQFQQSLRGTR